MLVTDSVFIEQCGHFFGDHVAIVRHRHERDFFSPFGQVLGSGRLRILHFIFRCISHEYSIHEDGDEKGIYSKASREERSGKVFWQAVQVKK